MSGIFGARAPLTPLVAFAAGALVLSSMSACGTDVNPSPADSGVDTDSSTMIEEPFRPWPEDAPPVAIPTFLPCPTGWSEVDGGEVVTCAPYASGVADRCAPGEAHFPGEAGCRVVGAACPAGEFAEGLPTDGAVVYVDAAAAPGGDGSRAAPFAALSEVPWLSLTEGTTVALSKGEFTGTAPLRPGVHLAGACAEQTVLVGIPGPAIGVITITAAGAAARASDLTVRGANQVGLWADGGGRLEATGVVVDRALTIGVYAGDAGSELTLADVVIQDTRADSAGYDGRGMAAQFGAQIRGTRVIVDQNRDGGVFVGVEGSLISLVDSVISNTLPQQSNGYAGRGVGVQDGGRFEATRTIIQGNRELGIFAGRVGTEVVLTDVVVTDTLPQGGGADNFGIGISIQDGARLEATRVVVDRSHYAGLALASPDTVAVLEDVVVRNTEPELRTGGFGRGLNVQDGSHLNATRLLIANNHNVGLVVSGARAEALLEDITIVDTQVDAAQGDRGYGMHVQLQARVEASGLGIRSSRTLGIAGIHSTLELEDVVVHSTEAATCARVTCNETPFGYGVAAISSSVHMTNFVVSDAATCGVFVAGDGGALDLSRGAITGATFGACVQIDGYDFHRLTDGVTYTDNAQNLEATSLPVPETVATARPR